ncbi:hypothetical protein TIFTF001_041784 [Ficus carica]|uniref:Uncharacterized protein n=1 Tax=Ficus carica TaxID=3494 RepID=A0AA87ZAP2_FICCA|nr:hypothetical protein TIFTF001_041784 [Ficus carica]
MLGGLGHLDAELVSELRHQRSVDRGLRARVPGSWWSRLLPVSPRSRKRNSWPVLPNGLYGGQLVDPPSVGPPSVCPSAHPDGSLAGWSAIPRSSLP